MHIRKLLSCGLFGLLSVVATHVVAVSPDHHEFEASLYAPFRGEVNEAREFRLFFSFIDATDPSTVAWQVQLRTADDARLIRSWSGEERLFQHPIETALGWDGHDAAQKRLPDGFYRVRMTAAAGDPLAMQARTGTLEARVAAALADAEDPIVQEWDIHIGTPPQIAMPTFEPLAVGARDDRSAPITGELPYTVYFGNLHTQSNDSDGGGDVLTCDSSQSAQTGAFGPGAGFDYARLHGLDYSAATEHNHYFDGSSGTNSSAVPQVAHDRYQAGLTAAINSNLAHPDFLAIYGMEWGVISNAGHMNIFNSNLLFAWEFNSSNQLIGDVFTTKSDYAAIYQTMLTANLIGQFNHPSSSTQFKIGGVPFAYDAAGDDVMVLAEIQNTSAFSNNTTETETGRSSYESAFKLALERGFHVAPATNQDNHCANWGASWTNRTAVLIPSSLPLNRDNFFDALRARRVFATSDKNSQLVFTANGHLMGERFNNVGALNLSALFANGAGRTVAQVQLWKGEPLTIGSSAVLASTATHSYTPPVGQHYYYAKITQDDGKLLWSAPIWVNQLPGVDTTAPSVTGNSVGNSGTIALQATASDNIGVVNVVFFIDGIERGQDSTAPYQIDFDSTVLANGTHTLVVHATDAALNEGISQPVDVLIQNTAPPDDVFANSFE